MDMVFEVLERLGATAPERISPIDGGYQLVVGINPSDEEVDAALASISQSIGMIDYLDGRMVIEVLH